VGVYDAKTRLSELLVRVEAGDQVVITRQGRPIARLVPYATVGADGTTLER
jgi:prevent-host-death family protein